MHFSGACIRYLPRFHARALMLGRRSLTELLFLHETWLGSNGEEIPWQAGLVAKENRREQKRPILLFPLPTISTSCPQRLPQYGIRLRQSTIQDILLFESHWATSVHISLHKVWNDARSAHLRWSA